MNNRPMDTGVLRLLNPSFMRKLYVTFPFASKEKLRLLGMALKGCVALMQNLEVLSVSVDLAVSDLDLFLPDMESLPRLHPRLRNLDLDHFRGVSAELNDLRHLAALPDLEDLTVMIRRCGDPIDWSIKFQALRNLTVSCSDFLVVGTFLVHIDAPQLRTLSVSERHARPDDMPQELAIHLRTLVTKCPALTSFRWRSSQAHMRGVGYLGTRRIGVPLAELVSPLLALRTLQHFFASFSGPTVPYTPEDLHAFAEAWPGLETFYLYDEGPQHSDEGRYADVESITAFARRCPRLRSIHIPVVRLDLSTGPGASDSELVEPVASPPALHSLPTSSPAGLHDIFYHILWHLTPSASNGDIKRLKRALASGKFFTSIKNLQGLSMEAQDLTPMLNMKSLPRSHPCLYSLKLNRGAYVGLSDLRSLSNLPNLEYLDVSPRSFWGPSDLPITLSGLLSLTLSDTHLGDTSILLTRLEAPRLQSFSFSETHGDSSCMSQEIPDDLRTLVAKYPALTSFKWTSMQTHAPRRGYAGNRQCDVPLAELVAPLLAHRAMRRFSVEFRGPIVPYTPADFRAFAEAWPDLETFRLYHDRGRMSDRIQQRAAVESVMAFARHCPRLRNLKIPRVMQHDSDPSVDSVHLPAAPHCLRELWVNYVAHSEFSRSREFEVQFRGLMERIFPFATILPMAPCIPR
ncbi:hypothetical protein GSI_11527 [Ganoderma sinense ZZ0214-1]|uniref:F-box domain-containing protein n=1 Tax=Ganoderma sinense ZZ0214-1 TaxID=1077348 RepID=A0A2G8RWA6_9APHY|nr:hypothetical protein GSI_11527 [Ganoderma sinense ZZ0214-1]